MLSLQSYLHDPCGTASIPYWKQKGLVVPENMKIVHERDYTNEMLRDYTDEPYFRLYHNLKDIRETLIKAFPAPDLRREAAYSFANPQSSERGFASAEGSKEALINQRFLRQEITKEVEIVSGAHNIDEFVSLINASYSDLSVTTEQMEGYRRTPVYCPDLWILLKEKASGTVLAGGIADYDREVNELILEWIQVLPSYRGRGYGQIIVNCLLSKMRGIAKFATVSGKVNNPTNPEALYRKCGFTGSDIWHILTLKRRA